MIRWGAASAVAERAPEAAATVSSGEPAGGAGGRASAGGHRGVALAAALVAALAAACADRDQAPTVRLLDLTREAKVEGVPPDPALESAGFARSRTVPGALKRAVRRLEIVRDGLDAEAREVLVAPAGSRYRFTVSPPPDPRLRLGLSLPPAAEEASVRFRVTAALEGGEPETVLDEYLLASPEGIFADREVELPGGGQMDFRLGFAHGFERYRVTDWVRDVDAVVDRFEATSGRRRFLFVHTYEPHDPYGDLRFAGELPSGRIGEYFGKWEWERLRDRGGLTPEEEAYVEALYDGDIARTDEAVGELFDRLHAGGHLDRAIVVVTSDHGEQFFEHGSWRHGMHLYDHQVLVPLIVRLPPALARQVAGDDLAGRVIESQVELVDLVPTLLELLELPSERPLDGRSLVPRLAGDDRPERPALVGNVNIPATKRRGLRTRRWKFVVSEPRHPDQPGESGIELYDLVSDPGEHANLAAEREEMAARFAAELERLAVGEEAAEEQIPDGIDPDLRRRLEALGYVGEPGAAATEDHER